jgi:hypothetical protein
MHLALADETQLPKEAHPYIRAITRELGVKAAMPLLLSSYLRLTSDDFKRVAQFLLVFIVRYSIIGNRQSSGAEDLMFKLARDVRSMVKDSSDTNASYKAAGHIKTSLKGESPDDETTKKAAATVTLDSADAKYVVLRLARYIQDPQKEVAPSGETNLEHIYPQNPEATGWDGSINQEKLEPLTWNLGNLTIFGKRANRKAANSEYAEKKIRFAQSKVLMTSEIPTQYQDWNEQSIKDRGERLGKRVVEIWNFDNPSRV